MRTDYFQVRAVLVLLLACWFTDGCVGVGPKGTMTFDTLEQPASMSAFLYGPDHALVSLGRGLQRIGTFNEERSCWSLFYSLLHFGECKDTEAIARKIDAAIRTAGGDGMVNVTITVKAGAVSWVHPLTLLPFWPTNTRARITGDIVKVTPAGDQVRPALQPVDNVIDVRIQRPGLDETEGLRLSEKCVQRGRLETVFIGQPLRGGAIGGLYLGQPLRGAVIEGLYREWDDMVPAEFADGTEEFEEFNMMLYLREKGQARGANVVQVLYWTAIWSEVATLHEQTPKAPSLEHLRYPTALLLVHWNCPSLPRQPSLLTNTGDGQGK